MGPSSFRYLAGSGSRPLTNIPPAASGRGLDRVSVPMWGPSSQNPIHRSLGGRLPANKLMERIPIDNQKFFNKNIMRYSYAIR